VATVQAQVGQQTQIPIQPMKMCLPILRSSAQLTIALLLIGLAIVRHSFIQPVSLRLTVPATTTAMVTPKPSPEDQETLQETLKNWLPKQGLKKPFLMKYATFKHDTAEDVQTAATERAAEQKCFGWVVPLENALLPSHQSGCLQRLPNNHELTASPWDSEPATGSARCATSTSNPTADGDQESHSQSLAPITTAPSTQHSDSEESNWVAKRPTRTDSAPFYKPSGYGFDDGDSSAGVW